jgi:heme-degrading monooxygenase HmoA
MYARMSRFAGLPPERIEATIREFAEGQLKALEEQPGYKGVLVGVDRAEGKAVAMTFWDSAENLRSTDRLADKARQVALESVKPSREPIVDRFEVVMQRDLEL